MPSAWKLLVVLAFYPSCQLLSVLSPWLTTGLLLHMIHVQVTYFLHLAISVPLALVTKLHLSIIWPAAQNLVAIANGLGCDQWLDGCPIHGCYVDICELWFIRPILVVQCSWWYVLRVAVSNWSWLYIAWVSFARPCLEICPKEAITFGHGIPSGLWLQCPFWWFFFPCPWVCGLNNCLGALRHVSRTILLGPGWSWLDCAA